MLEETSMPIESLAEKFLLQAHGLGLFKLLTNMATTAQVRFELTILGNFVVQKMGATKSERKILLKYFIKVSLSTIISSSQLSSVLLIQNRRSYSLLLEHSKLIPWMIIEPFTQARFQIVAMIRM